MKEARKLRPILSPIPGVLYFDTYYKKARKATISGVRYFYTNTLFERCIQYRAV